MEHGQILRPRSTTTWPGLTHTPVFGQELLALRDEQRCMFQESVEPHLLIPRWREIEPLSPLELPDVLPQGPFDKASALMTLPLIMSSSSSSHAA
jgi:hypothetical protein